MATIMVATMATTKTPQPPKKEMVKRDGLPSGLLCLLVDCLAFFGQNLFQLMYNHKPKSNVHLRKKHKTPDRKGGSTLFFPPKVNADCELCRQSVLHTVQVLNTMSCISEICALYRFLDTEKIAVCNITAMHASPCSLLRTVTTDINYFQCSLYTRSLEC